jgi:uncharacterized SAM-binding protein YcdF (DUF218 family)
MRRAAGWRRLAAGTLGLAAVALILGGLIFLPFAGRFLHQEDPLEPADLILVLAGARVERWLEAVELYREGWAPAIVVSPGPVDTIERELQARGILYPREGELARTAIVASGVPEAAVTVLPNGVDNTAHEAVALVQRTRGTAVGRVIVVTSPYHTRRTRLAFRRAFSGTDVHVLIRGSRYSEADPPRWWRRRADVRFVLAELPKLAAYAAGAGE